jgi:hypothetical protein
VQAEERRVNLPAHPWWWALVAACLTWYSTITLRIAVRGVRDVQTLLARLRASAAASEDSSREDS